METRTIYKDGKEMRCGYTTGSCAAAASKASLIMLIKKQSIEAVQIDTPKGWKLDLTIDHQEWSQTHARCSVQKDSGDDPDVTNGIHIYSEARWIKETEIRIEGGLGVGRITRPGLGLPIGSAAINPVPLEMIRTEIRKVLPPNTGVSITLTIPEGEKLAKRTFNPQLGIEGGISIIGTSGIVEPMSESAFCESLAMDLQMNGLAQGMIAFVPGNYGEDYCLEKGVRPNAIFKTSNFIGYMLEQAMKFKIPKILLVGHIGKFAKLAAGNFHTHNRMSDGRRETIAAYAALAGVDQARIEAIFQAVTTEAMITYLTERERESVFALMASAIQNRVSRFVFEQVEVEVILFSAKNGFLGQTEKAGKWMEELSDEKD